jgi:hypothetical protein
VPSGKLAGNQVWNGQGWWMTRPDKNQKVTCCADDDMSSIADAIAVTRHVDSTARQRPQVPDVVE